MSSVSVNLSGELLILVQYPVVCHGVSIKSGVLASGEMIFVCKVKILEKALRELK